MEAIKLVFKDRRDNSSTKANKMERETTDSPVTLEDLPVEVLDVVVENLTLIDLSQLRLVSKAMLFLTSGTRKWRALEHFKSTYERCLEQTGLEPAVYSILEFLCFEFNGPEDGSTKIAQVTAVLMDSDEIESDFTHSDMNSPNVDADADCWVQAE